MGRPEYQPPRNRDCERIEYRPCRLLNNHRCAFDVSCGVDHEAHHFPPVYSGILEARPVAKPRLAEQDWSPFEGSGIDGRLAAQDCPR